MNTYNNKPGFTLIELLLVIVIIGCIFYYESGQRTDRNLRSDEVLSTLDFRFSGKVYKIEELWSHSFLVTLKDVESEKNYDGRKLFKEFVAVIDNDFAEIIIDAKGHMMGRMAAMIAKELLSG